MPQYAWCNIWAKAPKQFSQLSCITSKRHFFNRLSTTTSPRKLLTIPKNTELQKHKFSWQKNSVQALKQFIAYRHVIVCSSNISETNNKAWVTKHDGAWTKDSRAREGSSTIPFIHQTTDMPREESCRTRIAIRSTLVSITSAVKAR